MASLFNTKMYGGPVGQPVKNLVNSEEKAKNEELILHRFARGALLSKMTNLKVPDKLPSPKLNQTHAEMQEKHK